MDLVFRERSCPASGRVCYSNAGTRRTASQLRGRVRGVQYAKNRLACSLFEQPYVTTKTAADRLNIERSTAYRAIDTLEDEGVLEEVTGKARNKEYRAKEIFEILEQPPQTY